MRVGWSGGPFCECGFRQGVVFVSVVPEKRARNKEEQEGMDGHDLLNTPHTHGETNDKQCVRPSRSQLTHAHVQRRRMYWDGKGDTTEFALLFGGAADRFGFFLEIRFG